MADTIDREELGRLEYPIGFLCWRIPEVVRERRASFSASSTF
jgi:hypothetical protein